MRGIKSAARAAAVGLLGVVAGITMMPVGTAQADSVNRWATANDYGYGYLYLEVLNSSTADLASVIAYPGNSGSANQWWSDYQLSNGYFALLNNNSGKALDRWDPHTGTGSDGGCSTPMQYSWVDEPQQYWGYRTEWSGYYGRYFNKWVNLQGCNGDPWQDTISVNFSTAASYGLWTTLFHSNRCVDGQDSATRCFWRRNGE
ncbi:RICIN domain-containing protein [Nonomuraea angiospora]|uniref:RICIN domain-containing protein n=1 Tax=Nonomuraea angiospora TaxID=46172 RepID=UPI00343ACD3B